MIYFIIYLIIIFLFAQPAWSYIDPGTSSAVFSALGYIGGLFAVAIGFLIWPIKRLWFIIRKKFGSPKKDSD